MPLRNARPSILLPLIVLLVMSTACRSTRADGALPAWSGDPAAGLDARVVLTGVGSARGDDADAAESARRAAMAAVLEQLVARVEAQTDSRQRETGLEHIDADGSDTRVFASDMRERIIRVTSEAELLGTRFELARASAASGPVTWARAVVDRVEMAEHTLATVREDLSRARTAADSARMGLALGSSPTETVSRAVREALAADKALSGPRAVVPLLTAIRPVASARTAAEAGRITSLDQDIGTLLAQVANRLELQLFEEARVGFGGQPLPVGLSARWDGEPLPGLLVAARFGAGPAASGRTDADGRVALSVPAPVPGLLSELGLRAGPDIDGSLGSIQSSLPVSFPRPSDSRVAIYSRHERVDAESSLPRSRTPSPLQPELEELMGGMHFPLVAAAAPGAPDVLSPVLAKRLAGTADYVMQVATRTAFSSTDSDRGPLWYRTSVELRLTKVATGETLTISIPERDTKAAGATPDQAATRSLAAALSVLSRPDEPSSLTGALRARFR